MIDDGPGSDGTPGDADVHAAPDLAVPLRAGPLRLVFDRGELRWIRLGEREVLRGLYVAVREEGWATVPAELEDLEIEAEPEAFRIRFRARHRRGGVLFDWVGRIQGGTDGRITYTMDGAAGSTFRRNRIGFCVLHPAEACAGRPCIVETVDGDRASSAFPSLVAPHQPFRNVRAILHEVTPGVEAEVRMEGETFETEDQRNWSDASFKTYGTPLHLPFPVEVAEGTRLAQSVTVRLFGVTSEPVQEAAATVPGALPKKRNSTEPVLVRVGRTGGFARPVVGLGGAGLGPIGAADAERLRSIGLDHVRADLRLEAPGWGPASSGRPPTLERSRRPSSWLSSCRRTRGRSCGSSRIARRSCGRASPAVCSSGPTGPPPTASPPSRGKRSPGPCPRPSSVAGPTATSPS